MKKINTLLVSLILLVTSAMAQVPEAFNFQAIARDQDGVVMDDVDLQVRLTIIDSADGGQQVYQELRSLTTNGYGSFSFQIGAEADYVTQGNFSDIEWGTGGKFIKIDYDPTNQFDWALTLGYMKFASVPYALAAGSVASINVENASNGDILLYNSNTSTFEPSPLSDMSSNLENVLNQGNSAGGMLITNLSNPINAQDAATKMYVDTKVNTIDSKIVSPRIATKGQIISVSFSGSDNLIFSQTSPSSQVVLRYEQASSTINIYPLSSSYINNKRIDAVFSIPYSAATGTYDVIISPNTSESHFLDNFFKIF